MVLFVHEAEVARLTDSDRSLSGAVEVLDRGFRDYANGDIITPAQERTRLVYPRGQTIRPYPKDMRILPAMVPSLDAAGIRLGCHAAGAPGRTSYTILLDFQHMMPLGILEDHLLHAIRSGSPTGLAARELARPDAQVLGVIGSSRIARVQVRAVCGQRPIQRIQVYSPNPAHRAAFAAEMQARLGVEARAVASARDAVEAADIVTLATNSHNAPVMDGAWLRPGALVASVTPGEMDRTTVARARLVLTSRHRILNDYTPWEPVAGAVRDGELDLAEQPTLGEVLLGRAEGRQTTEQIVYFCSPGVGFCDLAVARWVYDLACTQGLGQQV